VEYQREGYTLFQAMMAGIREESVGFLYNLEVEVTETPAAEAASEPHIHAAGLETPEQPAQLQYSAPGEDGETETHVERKDSATEATRDSRSGNPARSGGKKGNRKRR